MRHLQCNLKLSSEQLALSLILLLMAFLAKKQSLWKEGQATIPFVSPETSISREKRFKHFSIYWPPKSVSVQTNKKKRSEKDELAQRISKLIDEQEKNELRMNKVNGSIKKLMSKTTGFKQDPRETFSNFRPTTTANLSKDNQAIVNRLSLYKEAKQSKLRDRHGHRTNLRENQEQELLQKLKEEQRQCSSRGFCTSRRINLNLPHNYYPGPGTYEILRYLEDKDLSLRKTGSLSARN